jgi:hypothetical protein
MSEPKRTHAAQSAWQDCHVESGPVTVVASSVPRGHVIVVVQDAVARLVPRDCGETRQVNNGRTMHLCQNRCHCGETTENYCTVALPRRSESSLACWRVVSRAACCNTPVFFSADHTSAVSILTKISTTIINRPKVTHSCPVKPHLHTISRPYSIQSQPTKTLARFQQQGKSPPRTHT